MENVFEKCIEMYRQAFDVGIYPWMFFASMLYICFIEKDKIKKKYFIGFLLLFSIIYWCPITAYIIMEYCVGEIVYWRMFWILPMTITIAYAVVETVHLVKKKYLKVLVFAAFIAFVAYRGVPIYDGVTIRAASNEYKIDNETIQVCDIIREDAKAKGIEDRGVIVVNELVTTIKQYDGEIRMPYGRNMLRGTDNNKRGQKYYYNLYNAQDFSKLAKMAKKDGYQYLVYHAGAPLEVFTNAGYSYVDTTGSYYIFYLN